MKAIAKRIADCAVDPDSRCAQLHTPRKTADAMAIAAPDTTSERYRHECEVRHLIRAARDPKYGRKWVRDYLDAGAVASRREALRKDLNEQIALGNRGRRNEWIRK